MRTIGLHIQVDSTLEELAHKALRLGVTTFQCFLALKTAGRLIPFSEKDISQFIKLRKEHFGKLYLHSSYWVNLSDTKRTEHYLLERELALAKRLEFTDIVLHSGSSKNAKNKQDAINALAHSVNWLLEHNQGLTVILENVAHGGNAVGNDLCDFKKLLKQVDQPKRLKFCIDVAHAYLFGYDISNDDGQKQFIELVDDIMGWEQVALIHLNDTQEKSGSKIDKHHSVGDGSIGDKALKSFIMHPQIIDIPIIIEVPTFSEEQQQNMVKKVKRWQIK